MIKPKLIGFTEILYATIVHMERKGGLSLFREHVRDYWLKTHKVFMRLEEVLYILNFFFFIESCQMQTFAFYKLSTDSLFYINVKVLTHFFLI